MRNLSDKVSFCSQNCQYVFPDDNIEACQNMGDVLGFTLRNCIQSVFRVKSLNVMK